jgi:hypothetical protein
MKQRVKKAADPVGSLTWVRARGSFVPLSCASSDGEGQAAMVNDPEQRQRRNAKRWLWLIVAGCVALAALIAYTSLRAPDPESRPSEAPFPAAAAPASGNVDRNETQLR